ncbi:putative Gp75 [uncultured Mycobacterium sp.]|uniref:Putative Gp75 n=1 Tax=uncultured Mycobacterium sp. TaxID=171292 RepID=A0A1Y5PIG7_9MYCO|nr:putative Gp75 [uncultured Mycobacterium sp.]
MMNVNQVVVVNQRRGIGFFGAFFTFVIVAGLVVKFWVPILVVVAVGMLCWATWSDIRDRQQAKAALLARADAENAAVLRGDDKGVYGRFPPAWPAG